MEWYDWLRLCTAVFAGLSMYCLARLLHRGNITDNRVSKDIWWSVNALLFGLGAGSIEQVIRDRGITWVIPIGLLSTFVFYRAIRKTRKRVEKERKTKEDGYTPS